LKKKWRRFDDAREFVISLELKNQKEWKLHCNSDRKQEDIPSNPWNVYEEWKTLSDWLGSTNISTRNRTFLPFNEARETIRNLNITNHVKWRKFCNTKKFPKNIPKYPEQTYKKEWIDWYDWLGKGFLTFSEARNFVHALELSSVHDWDDYCKSNKKPTNIPTVPRKIYPDNWKDWGDWLGTGTIAPQTKSKNWLSFQDAKVEVRILAKKYNIKTWNDWNNAIKKGLIPSHIPRQPNEVYSKNKRKKK
jgi:hypothetical protein